MTGEEKQKIAETGTQNQEAYQAYLKGRFHVAQRTASGLRQAIEDLRQAVALDPSYAQAEAALSLAYSLLNLRSQPCIQIVLPIRLLQSRKCRLTRAMSRGDPLHLPLRL